MQKTALLFPGQGSQYVGMGKSLHDQYAVARETFEEAQDVLGFHLGQLCFEGDLAELTKTENTQPAILTASVAAYRVCMQVFNLKPDFGAGHSLGEFSALVCAGAVSFADALRLVRQRGLLMQEAAMHGAGRMVAVTRISGELAEQVCASISRPDHIVVVSNYNEKQQTVISGHTDAVSEACQILQAYDAALIPLEVSAAFHSPLMENAASSFEPLLRTFAFQPTGYPVISNVTAQPYAGTENIADQLAMQMTHAVQWTRTMEYLDHERVGLALELGPKQVLKKMMLKHSPQVTALSLDLKTDWSILEKYLASQEKAVQAGKPSFLGKCLAIAVSTQNRNWNQEEYQKGVVEPYNRIKWLQEQIESGARELTADDMKAGIDMLRSVFATKGVPSAEQNGRFQQLMDQTGTRAAVEPFLAPVEAL
ncbi:ACP S-malonyltransferase [Paenibacillus glufosinatiresistens]|uniref:ACP S-malonyltransferase n=1 Tax=Paenibacillus glufosinatiresistens TaxID=3070657 RepID=UPI00286DCE65|nr:ACP S-malonyltransferase [Paenibacillus sp. YX.27]